MGTYSFTKPCSTLANLFIREVEKIERGSIDEPFIIRAIERLKKQALEMNVFFAEVFSRLSEVEFQIETAENQKEIDKLRERIESLEEEAKGLMLRGEAYLLLTHKKTPQLLLHEGNKNKAIDRFCYTIEAGMIETDKTIN
jgi:hypothetical protein